MVRSRANNLLNAFLATKAVKIVLGIPLPESGFVDCEFWNLPAL
jgi:hypothetical protein